MPTGIDTLTNIGNGLAANDGTGDALRSGAAKINDNNAAIVTAVNNLAASQSAGMISYLLKSDMTADLAHADGVLATVTNDPTDANNAVYRKSGASGAGSWVLTIDRVTIVKNDLASTATGKGASLVGFQQAGTGAVARTVQEKSRADMPVTPKDYGAVGDGVTDDTVAIQKALDSISSGVFKFDGPYKFSKITIQNKSSFEVFGTGQLTITGTASSSDKMGVCLAGSLVDVEIHHLNIVCDGVIANRHAGIFSNSGVTVDGIDIHHNRVKNGINGISCNANLSGYFRNAKVHDNIIDTTVGVDSGYGYGLHFADGSGVMANAEIRSNTVINATRHSIYFAKGIGGKVTHNRVENHRAGVATGQFRAAINVLRSDDVLVADNDIVEPNDGAINLGKSGLNGNRLTARANRVRMTAASNGNPAILIGSSVPTTLDADINDGVTVEGAPTDVKVLDNEFFFDGNAADAIRSYCGLGVMVKGNKGRRVNSSDTNQVVNIYAAGGDSYNSDLSVSDNDFVLSGSSSVLRWGAGVVGTTFAIRIERNRLGAVAMFAGSVPDNPNIVINDQDVTGLNMASGVYANGRYQSRTRIASYDPDSLAAGTATAQGFSVPNAKAGDFCTLTLQNISTANLLISGQVNANNNVRMVLYNAGTVAVNLPAGYVDVLVSVNR